MRVGTPAFEIAAKSPHKSPRFTIALSFDSDNQTIYYFTSHADAAVPPGASVLARTIQGLSVFSQKLDPDKAVATIGQISFDVVDRAIIVTDQLAAQLLIGRSTRRQRVQVFEGYEGLAFADYNLIQTQIVDKITYKDGRYRIKCADIQREMRKDIFDVATTNLAVSCTDVAATIEGYDTSKFDLLAHGSSYSDAPNQTVGYFKLDDELVRYTGKTSTTFTGCTRGALNTLPAAHAVDAAASQDRRQKIEEYVYLEMPAVKLAYAILTGVLYDQDGATLPSKWHIDISTDFVRLADFIGIGNDLWDPADDQKGFPARFEGETKTDGKQFIESQLNLLLGCHMPIYNDGALGLRRMAGVLAGSAYVQMLDETNVVDYGELEHDFASLHNLITILWNFEPSQKRTTRQTTLVDAGSIATHEVAEEFKLQFRGLHGSRHSAVILKQRFDAFRDRYTGPPLRLSVTCLAHLANLEVGDIVRVRLAAIRDFVAGGTLDRSFEVQNIQIDKITGKVALALFASSQAAGALPATTDNTVLSDAFYSSQGTSLASVLTITGSNPGHVTADGTLTGHADANNAAAIYYYPGDLVIDDGVVVNITQNVQLRTRGFLQINGDINGVGQGLPGAIKVPNPPADESTFNPGTIGFIGSTEAGGSVRITPVLGKKNLQSARGGSVIGRNNMVPSFDLSYDGTSLNGLPSDLRGSSGSSGLPVFGTTLKSGGAGGPGGAGLIIVTRGMSLGASGNIRLSGGDGLAGDVNIFFHAGSGAGGAPGGLLIVLDGASATATGLTEVGFIAENGSTPITGVPAGSPGGFVYDSSGATQYYSYFVGTGDGTTFPKPSLSGARGALRVQYVPGNQAAQADPFAAVLQPPTSMAFSSGTAELLGPLSDGTVLPRLRVDVGASPDTRVLAYEIQFAEAGTNIWQTAPLLIGGLRAWLTPVLDGIDYDARARSLSAARQTSIWITATDVPVIGKLENPSNVTGLVFNAPFASWNDIADKDRRGYLVRINAGVDNNWDTATPAPGIPAGFITKTTYDTRLLVGGVVTLLVKALDMSGHASSAATTMQVDLRPSAPNVFLVTRQPDGTRQFDLSTSAPPGDLDGAEIRYFLGSTTDWNAMTPLHDGILKSFPFENNLLAAGDYTFAAKNIDQAGNRSANATFIQTSLGDPRIAGSIENVNEAPTWTGTKTSCHIDGATGWLVADGTGTFASGGTFAAAGIWNASPVSPITYVREIDLGTVAPFVPLVATTVDGSQTIQEQHSNDGSGYSSYAAIGPLVTARFIRIKVVVTGAYPKIKTMRTILSGELEDEILEDINSATLSATYRIGVGDFKLPITKPYAVIKFRSVTGQSISGAFDVEYIDKSVSPGPHVKTRVGGVLTDIVFDAKVSGILTQ